jgi:hypothetical protein
MTLIFVGSVFAQTPVPACPSGTQVQTQAMNGKPYIAYRCELPQKRNGRDICAAPTSTGWNPTAPVFCDSRVSFAVSYIGPLKCPVSQQVYLGSPSNGIQCLRPGWTAAPLTGSSCPPGFVQGSWAVFPNDACYGPKASTPEQQLAAHDINGFALGMSLKEVQEHAGHALQSLGRGDFSATVEGIDYDFGFSILGHLYRIDSKQPLGQFIPDAAFGRSLTEKLVAKYGQPHQNQLPDGPAFWEFLEPYQIGPGMTANRTTLSLSAMLMSGYNQAVTLNMKLMDFRIMRHDLAIANSGPRSKAEHATKF